MTDDQQPHPLEYAPKPAKSKAARWSDRIFSGFMWAAALIFLFYFGSCVLYVARNVDR